MWVLALGYFSVLWVLQFQNQLKKMLLFCPQEVKCTAAYDFLNFLFVILGLAPSSMNSCSNQVFCFFFKMLQVLAKKTILA